MPSLQLDLTADLGPEAKGALAKRLSLTYSRIMGSDPRLMTVVVRTLPAGSVWHCTEGEPVPGTLLMCDVRAGRTPQTRDELARPDRDHRRGHGGRSGAHQGGIHPARR